MKALIAWLAFTVMVAEAADFQSPYLAVGFERQATEFSCFAVDGLGQGKLSENPVMPTGGTNGALQFFQTGTNRFGCEPCSEGSFAPSNESTVCTSCPSVLPTTLGKGMTSEDNCTTDFDFTGWRIDQSAAAGFAVRPEGAACHAAGFDAAG